MDEEVRQALGDFEKRIAALEKVVADLRAALSGPRPDQKQIIARPPAPHDDRDPGGEA